MSAPLRRHTIPGLTANTHLHTLLDQLHGIAEHVGHAVNRAAYEKPALGIGNVPDQLPRGKLRLLDADLSHPLVRLRSHLKDSHLLSPYIYLTIHILEAYGKCC